TLIVADEPTGDLDSRSAEECLNLLVELKKGLNKTIIMVTHDPRAAVRAERVLHLEKGQLVRETVGEPTAHHHPDPGAITLPRDGNGVAGERRPLVEGSHEEH